MTKITTRQTTGRKHILPITAAFVALAAGHAVGQVIPIDGSFESGSPPIPPFSGEIDPPLWDDFGNANLFTLDSDNVPAQDGNVGIKMFSALFSSFQFTFAIETLPDFFPKGQLPGGIDTTGDGIPDTMTDADGNGFPEVEVTDDLGTRMVEYYAIPVAGASVWRTFVSTTLLDPVTRAAIAGSLNDPPAGAEISPGDRLRLTFWHRKVSADLVDPVGAQVQGNFRFRTNGADAGTAAGIVDITNDPEDEWVEYSFEAVVPDGTLYVEVQALYFGIWKDFIPLDQDGDGKQDFVLKDTDFSGTITPGEESYMFDGPQGPRFDTDGDGILDAWGTFVPIFGTVPGGAAFFDNFSLENLGPAPSGCNVADLASPFNSLTFADISAFLSAFSANDPAADLADPIGSFTFADISAFLAAFSAGCP